MSKQWASILVIDDDADNRELVADFLSDEDYRLHMAKDGGIAWDMLQQNPGGYDVLLLDLLMPNMGGMELLSLIKDHGPLKNIPVILLSGRAGRDDIVAGINAGAFYYLTKPFDRDLLRSIVKTAVADQRKYAKLQQEIKHGLKTFQMMRQGEFFYSTLAEANVLTQFLSQACPNPERVVLGLSELLINAVEHGNLEISYKEKTHLLEQDTWQEALEHRLKQEPYRDRQVKVLFQRFSDRLSFTITDEGQGFDWQPFLRIAPERCSDNHGRGIAMASVISFDKLEYKGKGNEVVATIKLQ